MRQWKGYKDCECMRTSGVDTIENTRKSAGQDEGWYLESAMYERSGKGGFLLESGIVAGACQLVTSRELGMNGNVDAQVNELGKLSCWRACVLMK